MFKKSRGISPIFAVLILISIAVVGGVVIYLYTSGYLGGMTGGGSVGQEKVAIEAIVVESNGSVTLHCKSMAGGDIIIEDVILKDSAGENIEVLTLGTPVTLPATGDMTTVNFMPTSPLTVGDSYSCILISRLGSQFVSIQFKAT